MFNQNISNSVSGTDKHTSFCNSRELLLCSKKDCICYFSNHQHTLIKVVWVMWVTTDSSCHLCVLTTGASVLQYLSKRSWIISTIHISSQTNTLVRSWWSWTCDWPFSWPKPITKFGTDLNIFKAYLAIWGRWGGQINGVICLLVTLDLGPVQQIALVTKTWECF